MQYYASLRVMLSIDWVACNSGQKRRLLCVRPAWCASFRGAVGGSQGLHARIFNFSPVLCSNCQWHTTYVELYNFTVTHCDTVALKSARPCYKTRAK